MKKPSPPRDPFAPLSGLDDQLRRLRRGLRLVSLCARSRSQHLGKWIANGLDFAERCATARDVLAGHLGRVPHTAADMRAQAARVKALEYAQHHFRRLLKEIDDTLLVERAGLYRMSTGVLRSAEAVLRHPYLLDEDERTGVSACVKSMRREFDRKNRKIAAGKAAAKGLPAPAHPSLLPEG